MIAPDRDPRETLARIRAQADAATPGPCEIDLDGDIQGRREGCCPDPEMDPMVGTLDRSEDTVFIAASRTDVPRLVDALEKVLELHKDDGFDLGHGRSFCAECLQDDGMPVPYPCPTVTAITVVLEGEPHD